MIKRLTATLLTMLICALALSGCAQSAQAPDESPIVSPDSSVAPTPAPSPTPSKTGNTSYSAKQVDVDNLKSEDYLTGEEADALLDQTEAEMKTTIKLLAFLLAIFVLAGCSAICARLL